MTEQEFVGLLNEHHWYLRKAALAVLGNEADVADALQDASLKGYICRKQLRGGIESFRPWMKKILLNTCLKLLKQRKRVVPLGAREEVLSDTSHIHESPGEHDIWEVVALLAPQLRETVALRYVFDLSQEEVAAQLNIPVGTVKSRLNRALESLRSSMQSVEEEAQYEANTK